MTRPRRKWLHHAVHNLQKCQEELAYLRCNTDYFTQEAIDEFINKVFYPALDEVWEGQGFKNPLPAWRK